jgi:hypothetical protein
MANDPAIQKAQELWQQKNPKQALLVMAERISELNDQLERPQRPKYRAPIVAFIIGVALTLAVMWAVRYSQNSTSDLNFDSYFLETRYKAMCEVYVIDNETICQVWAESLVRDYPEAAKSCETAASGNPTFDCLRDHYAPLPLE